MSQRLTISSIIVGVVVFCLALYFIYSTKTSSEVGTLSVPIVQNEEPLPSLLTEISQKNKITFVGDIMLARDVEKTMRRNGFDYPYLANQFSKDTSFVVANFEASVPAQHTPTPNNTFRFSVASSALPFLSEAGITHVSLANNHSFDYGVKGYNETKISLQEVGVASFGHPIIFSTSSITYLEVSGRKVALLALHTLYAEPSTKVITETLAEASLNSDLQIIYVHWGTEYNHLQSTQQRALATKLSLAGADVIIGHHPHVIQGIERINKTLVFYSLGNYIFDQYFSEAVATGLLLHMNFDNEITFTLVPVSTQANRTQPAHVDDPTAKIILKDVATYSDTELQDDILNGLIRLIPSLASSTELDMMAP